MRLTTRSNLAARVLMYCAVHEDRIVRTAEVAARCNASPNHLARVVQALHSTGHIETLRGRTGGLRLARSPDRICIGDVFRLFETGIPIAECFDAERNTCPLSETCRLRNYVVRAQEAFYHELDMVTLEDLVRGNCGLSDLLTAGPEMPATCAGRSAA